MSVVLLAAILCTAPAEAPKKAPPPATKELFAKEAWYKDQKGKEQVFVGTLRYAPRAKGVVGFGRHNPYTLEMNVGGKKDVREVYVGGKPDLLTPYVDKAVKITGKPVELEVVGRNHREVWPANVELAPAKGAKP